MRAAFYVDGFNLYHAVADLGEPFLKWCNLRRLAEILIPSNTESVVKVVFCSAYYPGDSLKRFRHDEYLKALRIHDVEIVMGHYVREPKGCNACGSAWQKPTEKETDINVALSLYHDAWADVFDKAYLVSGDSDQAATAKFFRAHFPKKELITVAPPGRNFSVHIANLAHGRISITKDNLDRCVMLPIVRRDGFPSARRPREYEPPKEWVHPDCRPSKDRSV